MMPVATSPRLPGRERADAELIADEKPRREMAPGLVTQLLAVADAAQAKNVGSSEGILRRPPHAVEHDDVQLTVIRFGRFLFENT